MYHDQGYVSLIRALKLGGARRRWRDRATAPAGHSRSCAVLACALTGAARAAPGLLIGVADDTLKWTDKPQAQRALGYTRDLGIRAVRVTVPWQPRRDAPQPSTSASPSTG